MLVTLLSTEDVQQIHQIQERLDRRYSIACHITSTSIAWYQYYNVRWIHQFQERLGDNCLHQPWLLTFDLPRKLLGNQLLVTLPSTFLLGTNTTTSGGFIKYKNVSAIDWPFCLVPFLPLLGGFINKNVLLRDNQFLVTLSSTFLLGTNTTTSGEFIKNYKDDLLDDNWLLVIFSYTLIAWYFSYIGLTKKALRWFDCHIQRSNYWSDKSNFFPIGRYTGKD